uniref:Uncharacterized protein n=1 Tax=Knipowitschia caucasica TaxID=637954 RepID=A0AAV2KMS5_KNICA
MARPAPRVTRAHSRNKRKETSSNYGACTTCCSHVAALPPPPPPSPILTLHLRSSSSLTVLVLCWCVDMESAITHGAMVPWVKVIVRG